MKRTKENAPQEVSGGVALSLWMLGAHETDVRIVADKVAGLEALNAENARLRIALDRLRPVVIDAAHCKSSEAWGVITLAAQEALASAEDGR